MRIMNPRLGFRALLFLLLASTFVTFIFLLRCNGSNKNQGDQDSGRPGLGLGVGGAVISRRPDIRRDLEDVHHQPEAFHQARDLQRGITYQEIDCLINDDYSIQGWREGEEVFVPFSFIEKYFEVYGRLAEYDGYDRFEWQHSNARIYQQEPYKSDSIFMSFNHYNVEARDRVKYISGVEGVPISTQWGPQGYFYPIQIAQFGLSHYSKNLTDKYPRMFVYEDAEDGDTSRWNAPDRTSQIRTVHDDERDSNVIEIQTSEMLAESQGFTLPIKSKGDFVLTFDAKFFTNFTMTVTVEADDGREKPMTIHYTSDDDSITHKGSHLIYGLGPIRTWRTITRDLVTDFRKAVGKTNTKSVRKTKAGLRKVLKVMIHGHGRVDNISLWTHSHMSQFFDAANWLVHTQDSQGGWAINVERKLDEDIASLPPGWYSAMAQGQAISTLVRAYKKTQDNKYLSAALKATKIFRIPSQEGGVLARLFDKYPWYEEYPTTPSSFVLNGFIYSLIGLYDLQSIASPEEGREALQLYNEGIRSLKMFLPLFDTGSGTIYDLRHLSLHKAPNLARWDYHATHISQLQLMSSIDPDPVFKSFLDRWIGYTKGKRAKHN